MKSLSVIGKEMPKLVSHEISMRFSCMSFVCALLVVFIHATPWMQDCVSLWPKGQFGTWVMLHLFKQGICQIAVPFFVFTSGFFATNHIQQKGWYLTALKRRILSILVPFVIWNVLWMIMCISFGGFSGDVMRSLGLTFMAPGLSPTWYLRNLLFLIVLSPVIFKMLSHDVTRYVLLATTAVLYCMISPWPWHHRCHRLYYFFSFSMLFYFSLGAAVRMCYCSLLVNNRHVFLALILGLLCLFGRMYLGMEGYSWSCYFGVASIPFLMYSIWHLLPSQILRLPYALAVVVGRGDLACIYHTNLSFTFSTTLAYLSWGGNGRRQHS